MTDISPVRFAEGSDDIVEGLAIPFGGPFRGNADFYRTRFDKADLHLDWFPVRPVLYDHDQDPEVRAAGSVVGTVKTEDITDYDDGTRKGKWVRAQLDKRHAYFDAIKDLVTRGALGWSHGTMPYLIDAEPPDRQGVRNITNWPVAEFTLTPVEANPDAFAVHATRSADMPIVLEVLGASEDEIALRGWLPEGTTQGDLDDGDFAWVATDKSLPDSARRKLPYKVHGKVNEAGWKAAWSRAHQSGTDFTGGPSQADVIKKLLADAPEGVDTKYDDGKETPPGGRSVQVAGGIELAEPVTEPTRAVEPEEEPVPEVRAGARNSKSDQTNLDAAHKSAHMAMDYTMAAGANCPHCPPAHEESDNASPQSDGAASDDGDDESTTRSADPGAVVLTVMGDVEPAVRASWLEKAAEVGRAKAATLRR